MAKTDLISPWIGISLRRDRNYKIKIQLSTKADAHRREISHDFSGRIASEDVWGNCIVHSRYPG